MTVINFESVRRVFSDRKGIVAPLTERQRRTLVAAAKVLVVHGSGPCRLIQNAQHVMLTDWFIEQLREIVDLNVCIRCGGTGRLDEANEHAICDLCEGTGIG